MSIYDDDLDLDDEQDQQDERQESPRGLRRAANQSGKLKKENADLKRELAFAKAGIDLADPRMGYFVRGYDGDLEPQAIRAAASEAGFIAPPRQAQPDENAQQAAGAQQRIGEALAGAPSAGGGVSVEAQMDEAFRTGGVEAMLDVVRQQGIPISGLSD
jgi:hypothetical protein